MLESRASHAPRDPADAALVWFRRDLRDYDHAALYHALKAHRRVYCAFCFDTEILDALPVARRPARRVHLARGAGARRGPARPRRRPARAARPRARGDPAARRASSACAAVYANHDYEPAAIDRDAAVGARSPRAGIAFRTFKDQVIFEKDEVLTGAGRPSPSSRPTRTPG